MPAETKTKTCEAPRSAYVHVPFCRHRCGYCNFTLVAGRDDLIENYLRALEIELSWRKKPRPVDTLYFGGGTPSHLDGDALRRLLELTQRWFVPQAKAEITLEANPADVTADKVAVLSAAGVNRISLGAQSFQENKLHLLERDHTRETIHQAVTLCRQRFDSLAIDLIFATPDETLDDWQDDLQSTLELPIDHVSTYGLTFERGTTFWGRRLRSELTEADEELWRSMYLEAIETLTAAGLEHYEVSNFARHGHRSRHNETYWTGHPYDAAGPGAARFIDGRRETNHRSTTTYLKRVLSGVSPVDQVETLPPVDAARERLVFGLRRLEGVNREIFARQTSFPIEQLAGDAVKKYLDLGMLESTPTHLRLTRRGLLVSDAIWPDFLYA